MIIEINSGVTSLFIVFVKYFLAFIYFTAFTLFQIYSNFRLNCLIIQFFLLLKLLLLEFIYCLIFVVSKTLIIHSCHFIKFNSFIL